METRRCITVRTWSESWFESLPPIEKLIWIYLNTNAATNMLGAYSMGVRRIAYECNTSISVVKKAIKKLEEAGKLIYRHDYVILLDWMAHQAMNHNMRIAARKEYDQLPEEVRLLLSERTREAMEKLSPAPPKGSTSLPPKKNKFPSEKEKEKEEEKEQEEGNGKETEKELREQDHYTTPSLTPHHPKADFEKKAPARYTAREEADSLTNVYREVTQEKEWIATLCRNHHLSVEALQQWLALFLRKLQNEGETKKEKRDFQRHFASWLNIQLSNNQQPTNNYSHENKPSLSENNRTDRLSAPTDTFNILRAEAEQRLDELRAAGTLPEIPDA